ncbi:polyphosphate polymerase domain-containing protein [Herbiconiux liangxiaofengii]|uniref:polyphosphate polymerase domain-containing protein n=1 Tax=Herbiconiux liangxiaofengii TaxID=3342795 RepID=UPI0035B97982
MTPTATDLLGVFAPISLDELTARASLQTRVDRKYVVPRDALPGILADLGPDTRVLELGGRRDFRYESVYFDTPDLASYRMAVHARRRRFKMRTRAYVDSSTAYLEVKTRGARSATVKERLEYDFDQRGELNDDGLEYAHESLDGAGFDLVPEQLRRTVVTTYHRATLFIPGPAERAEGSGAPAHPESRATIDTRLGWELDRSVDGTARRLETPGIAIVETKSGSRPSGVDRILWAHGHRPSTISKYGTGLAALNPALPSNKWSRTLRRHFTGSAVAA